VDLLQWPVVGRIFGWRHARRLFQLPALALALIMIWDGLTGPAFAPKNLVTTLGWIHLRGLLAVVLLGAGNFFCFACPLVLVRDFARKFWTPRLNWPRPLRTKWLSIGLFALVLFVYEAFHLWASPPLTAWLILAYFAGVVVIDALFKHATFCKFICPIGQFNFVASTLSPLEVQVREPAVCSGCATKDCIRGRRGEDDVVVQRGCELALFQPVKVGNLDCTFCLDCVHACPHDNVGIRSRVPAEELLIDSVRSGIGRLARRPDLSALAILFTFGALMNAFGMVSPIYTLERGLAAVTGVNSSTGIFALIFTLVVIVEPVVLLGLAAAVARGWGGLRASLPGIATRYSYALVPFGFGLWLAHYGFHLLTGLYTIVPLVQNAAQQYAGSAVLGPPRWNWVGVPVRFVQPIQFGFVVLGFLASLFLLREFAEEDAGPKWLRAFAPWAAVCLVLFGSGIWLILQPMDMRGTFLE
jgi:polyferredoxin